ncbi:hypothetical protein HNR62_001837 [Oceanisphaera litoralis]|uniref:hypothetical protein n=1 Tax=Oceanisphaera litoralis TaxID=225144 RepID=UPI00195AE12D|nr:hypothetical protein [Oceanisphaera litoralis]MBM7455958.1 hypothetical protein [Oceanisphaera litoralis]
MEHRKRLYWVIFLGLAGVIAIIPEYFFTEESASMPVQTRADFSPQEQGQLATLRSGQKSVSMRKQEGSIRREKQAVETSTDLFAPHSWYVAPPRVPVAVVPVYSPPPRRPVAPPLPFRFIGKLDDSQKMLVFLQRGEEVHVVSVGDVIDGTYRVDGVTDDRMTLVYLPLQATQSLNVGSKL